MIELNNIGDTGIIRTRPTIGVQNLDNISQSVEGLATDRTISLEARISTTGGIEFDTVEYIRFPFDTPPTIDETQEIVLEFRVTRTGSSTTNTIIVNSIEIADESLDLEYANLESLGNSVYSRFFGESSYTSAESSLSLNILEKIWSEGIVPVYQERTRDFLDFWRSIIYYFVLLVGYTRNIGEYGQDRVLLVEYLTQRGMFLCGAETLTELLYLKENFYKEIAKRGTFSIVEQKGCDNEVNGELLRMICFDRVTDEFLFEISEPDKFGWTVNRWSPMYKGTDRRTQLNKFYEISLERIPTINRDDFTIDENGVISFDNNDTPNSGIGSEYFSHANAINVDPNLDYEFSFDVHSINNNRFIVGLDAYDKHGIRIDLEDSTGASTNSFIDSPIIIPETSPRTSIKCLILNRNATFTLSNQDTSINIGSNLKFTSDNICCVIPRITQYTGNPFVISNIRFAPLNTNYGTGFLNSSNVVQSWTVNNNGLITNQDIDDNINRYLISYKSPLINNNLRIYDEATFAIDRANTRGDIIESESCIRSAFSNTITEPLAIQDILSRANNNGDTIESVECFINEPSLQNENFCLKSGGNIIGTETVERRFLVNGDNAIVNGDSAYI